MNTVVDSASVVESAVPDVTRTPLAVLAAHGTQTGAEVLRNVLSQTESGRVPVAAFNSAI